MAEERLQRRLAAILSADVVGYSRLMGVPRTRRVEDTVKHRFHTKEARAKRGLLSNLLRQSRKIISAVE